MIQNVFAVYDKAVGAHLPPFFCRSKGEALRSFSEACNDASHQFRKHGLDYVLVYLGEYDDVSGLFNCREPVRIVNAYECLVIADDPFTDDKKVESSGNGSAKLPM
jgi:hypothetical protein